jgi:hypothetical protein
VDRPWASPTLVEAFTPRAVALSKGMGTDPELGSYSFST